MSGERFSWVQDLGLRQTAFSIEQMAPGGIDRPDPGIVRPPDLDHANRRLEAILGRPTGRDDARKKAVQLLLDRTHELRTLLAHEQTEGVIYLAEKEYHLAPRLRSAAIEIDFCFGDKDGVVSARDINEARRRYGEVRGPVGWNRLLLTDEIERQLFPERTLRTTEGLRLLPEDWLVDGPDPLLRLRKVVLHLDDAALARTYADVAARLATIASRDPSSQLGTIFESALVLLGLQIRERNSVRPTITDIARIGCEDPEIKAQLRTPIEMSRKLKPAALLDRYLLS
jgi:hypothetical protein